MPETTDTQPPAPGNKKFLAVLLLDPPHAPWKAVDWHWKAIAGVPFLLRNILNIQRGGVDRLILYMRKNQGIDEELRRRVAADPRVRLQVRWIVEPQQMIQEAGGSNILILEGSALHHKTEIASVTALAPGAAGQAGAASVLMGDETMSAILQQLDDFAPSRLEEVQRESSGASSEGRMLAYLPGAGDRGISRQEDFLVQHEWLMQTGGGLGNDSLLTRMFSRPVSRLMTRFFVGTPFTPNQITLLSFILGLASAWCFYHLDYRMGLIGGGLLLLAIWVDGVDGEIARLKFMETKMGAQLDIICDNIVHVILFFSIGMGLHGLTGQSIYQYLGGLAAGGSLISFLLMGASVVESKDAAAPGGKPPGKSLADKLANRDFTYFLVLTALAGKVELFIWVTAVGSNVFALYLIYCKLKRSKG